MKRLVGLLILAVLAVACSKPPAAQTATNSTTTTAVTSTAPPAPVTITTEPSPGTRPSIIPVTPTDPATVNGSTTSTPVPPATPDFTLGVTPGTISLMQTIPGVVTLATSIQNGFNSAIALASTVAPLGTWVAFSATSIPAPGAGFVKVTVTPAMNTPPGSYTIRFVAAGGGQTHVAPLTFSVSAFSGNCINPKCGNLGTKTYTADIITKLSPNYVPLTLLFFPAADKKSGVVADRESIKYAAKHWPAGYTISSFYGLKPCPTPDNGKIETCDQSGTDAGGSCLHRWAGIVEWDAPVVYQNGGGWTFTTAYQMYGKAIVDAAANKWLATLGTYLKPPCAELPCTPGP